MPRLVIAAILASWATNKGYSQATPPAPTTSNPPDPYGRESPKSALLGFLRYGHSDNFAVAALYLQLTDAERAKQGELLAQQLRDLLDRALTGRVQLLSDKPEGSLTDSRGPNIERAGTITVDQKSIDLLLVRTTPARGPPIWLVSSETLREVPALYSLLSESALEHWIPNFLRSTIVFGVRLSDWLILLLLLPVSRGIAYLIIWMARTTTHALKPWLHLGTDRSQSLHAPISFILTVIIHGIATSWLELPLLVRLYYNRVFWILILVAAAWFMSRLVQRIAAAACEKVTGSRWAAVSAAVLLCRRVFDALLIILVVILSLDILGFDTSAALAGLGIGGIAIALGAQKSLENFLGGVNLLSDGLLRIGDRYQLGNRSGIVEDVRLRSTRFRMSEGTALTVPNGVLAAREIENVSDRERTQLQCIIQLSRETTADQLHAVLTETRRILDTHEKVERDARASLAAFGTFSLDVELSANISASTAPEFSTIREDILFQIMNAVEACGARLAFPSQTLYMAPEQAKR